MSRDTPTPPAKPAPSPAKPSGKAAGQGGPRKGRGGQPRRPMHDRLRRGVGIIVINDDGKVLAGLRYHSRGDAAGQAAWQLPQGGMEARERPLATAYRELREETGLVADDVELIAEMPRWTRYLLPKDWQNGKRFIGQTQRWFLFRYKKHDTPPISAALHKEFTELGWVEVNWLIGHVIAFRQPVYRQVFRHFAPYLAPHDKIPD